MLRLDVWLKMYGRMRAEELWVIPKWPRVRFLLNLWGGPCSEEKNKFVVVKDFDGELKGNWETIKDELEMLPLGYRRELEKLDRKEMTDEERMNRLIFLP